MNKWIVAPLITLHKVAVYNKETSILLFNTLSIKLKPYNYISDPWGHDMHSKLITLFKKRIPVFLNSEEAWHYGNNLASYLITK